MSAAPARISKLAAAAALCLAAMAGPAWAQTEGHALDLTGPATATVGQPIVFQATGSYPSTDFFSSWLDIHAIPASVVSSCPVPYLNASQLSGATSAQGGDTVAIAQRANGDAAGRYSQPFAFTPRVAGQLLICAYANDGATWTHAMDQQLLTVRSADDGASGDPAPTAVTPIAVAVSQSYRATRTSTRFSALTVSGVPSGAKVVATCRYKGRTCTGKARRTFTRRNASGTVSLKSFTKVALKPGSVIRIQIDGPGAAAAVKRITIRRNKAPRTTG